LRITAAFEARAAIGIRLADFTFTLAFRCISLGDQAEAEAAEQVP
jgi:hypothetical protein